MNATFSSTMNATICSTNASVRLSVCPFAGGSSRAMLASARLSCYFNDPKHESKSASYKTSLRYYKSVLNNYIIMSAKQ